MYCTDEIGTARSAPSEKRLRGGGIVFAASYDDSRTLLAESRVSSVSPTRNLSSMSSLDIA
jgi:hypothetical protein